MCLSKQVYLRTKDQRFKLSKDEKGYYGWKVYDFVDHRTMKAMPQHFGPDQYINRWINSKSYRQTKTVLDSEKKSYKCGFHVYLRKHKTYGDGVCRKVYVKGIVAKGIQYPNSPTIVCKRIFIVSKRST